ncbi:MAG: aromatic-ring-hydroxylating dioxygenase, beta subunit [Massilia sp.]|jgi:ethylbenzene dioxygenase beta subunit|nr:aromatic-ring-hydroxylating dioxygenase, beta subunit [Massilia sp.]
MLLDLDFDVSTDGLGPAEVSLETQHRLQQFLYLEARLLDERRLADWLALWTDDGMYWIPQAHGQQSPYDHISLAWEDKMLREVRMKRLSNARNWSQQPVTRTSRLVGNVSAAGFDGSGKLVVHSVFQMTEWRMDAPRQMAGRITHKLAPDGCSWKIHMKRVDLVNCDAVHDSLQVFI